MKDLITLIKFLILVCGIGFTMVVIAIILMAVV